VIATAGWLTINAELAELAEPEPVSTISYSISPLPITVAPVSASPASTIEIIGMLLTGDSLRIVAGTGTRAGRVMTSNAVSARAESTEAAPVGNSRRRR
jgi:hypothetical protein